ncbi:MAG: hypothetical protein O2826_03465 [Chloroflexi bacterium]|nr:hypothetical protein [Chloroflexota bacterium]MDA1173560.1 hypothetical protein [Chloroflexota bacterium]
MITKRAQRSDYAPSVRPRPVHEVDDGAPAKRQRPESAPSVRPRTARQDGQRRLTPGYLDDLTDTKVRYISDGSGSASRTTLITPPTGRRVRVVRVAITQVNSDANHFAELYFRSGTDIETDATKAIDLVKVPDQGEGATRTWSRGTGPVGSKNEVLSLRWTTAPTSSHKFIVEYTEER